MKGLVVGNMRRAEVVTLAQHIDTQLSSKMGSKGIFAAQVNGRAVCAVYAVLVSGHAVRDVCAVRSLWMRALTYAAW